MTAPAVYDAYRFLVEIEGRTLAGFAEAGGLDADARLAEWWQRVVDTIRKLIEPKKHPNVRLIRGRTDSSALWDWYRQSHAGQAVGTTRDVVVVARDELRRPVRAWCLANARCTSFVGPALDPATGGMSIEAMVLTCDAVRVTDPPR